MGDHAPDTHVRLKLLLDSVEPRGRVEVGRVAFDVIARIAQVG